MYKIVAINKVCFVFFLVKLENFSYKEHKVNKINRYYCSLNSES